MGDQVAFGFRATDALALPVGELARE